MNKVRIGIVGLGNMGEVHANRFIKGEVPEAELTAICDSRPEKLAWAREHLGGNVHGYEKLDVMLASKDIDAVLIATPHYAHAEIAIEAFRQGLHVLCEKPAGVYTKQVRLMNDAAAQSGKVFGIMYNARMSPLYQKLREMIASGELGAIKRTNWTITNWYRPQSYYDSGAWRGTWEGEGGGVLLNQAPHQLDLWQWVTGMMPVRMRAFCSFGRYRNIEVEDDVTAYAEYANGSTGVFITSVGETPGTNRFEIAGDRGKIVVEDNKLTFWRLRVPEPEHNRQHQGRFGQPECWKCDVPVDGPDLSHTGIIRDWVSAILHGTPLLAPGEEGIHGLTLSNAMLLSSWTDQWVTLPLDEELFHKLLQEKIRESAK